MSDDIGVSDRVGMLDGIMVPDKVMASDGLLVPADLSDSPKKSIMD